MLKRREFVFSTITLAGLSLAASSQATDIRAELEDSDLVYLTAIKSNGQESSCQSEIWYVWDGKDIFVCTNTNAWRTRAIVQGLQRSRIWVGDLGNWKRTDGSYKSLPMIEASGSIIHDKALHAQALDLFGDKYPISWLRYKSIFTEGLEDGSRSLLRYRPQMA
jgi:hypothetical protein